MTSESGRFVLDLSERSKYTGEVDGLLKKDVVEHITNELVSAVWHSCRRGDDLKHRSALFRVTALLISSPGVNRKLLHVIAWSQVSHFSLLRYVVPSFVI